MNPSLRLQKIAHWFRLKKLEWEVSRSERFQKECERLACFTLAELEKGYRAEISAEIRRLKESPPVR